MIILHSQFHYADNTDKILIFFAVFGAVVHGAATPLQFIIFGELVNNLIDFQVMTNSTVDLEDQMTNLAIYYVYLSIGTLMVAYMQMGFFALTAVRQAKKIRIAFFQAVMRQDIGWFDTYEAGELNSRLIE